MKNDIRNKLDEHIKEILAKPSISNEDYAILRERFAELPAERQNSFAWDLLPFLLLLPLLNWESGGENHGV